MRDEYGAWRIARLVGWVAVSAGVLTPRLEARADGLAGTAQVQYQSVEQRLTLLDHGAWRPVTLSSEAWIQNYDVTQTARWGPRLNFFGQLRVSDISRPGSPEGSRVPYGTVRLVHPLFGIIGSYSPTRTTGTIGPSAAGVLGSETPVGNALSVTTRTRETSLSGYVAPRLLPRLDLAWDRLHRDADLLGQSETATNRRANLNYDAGPLNLHAGFADRTRENPAGGSELAQRSLSGGGGLHIVVSPKLAFQTQYDYAQSGRTRADMTRSHSGTLTGDLHRSPRSGWNLFYAYRRSISGLVPVGGDLTDHEGSLLYSRQLSRMAKFTGGAGLRTDRTMNPTGNDLLRYGTAVLSADGDLRRGWRGQASFAHTSNWLPGHAPYSLETYRAGTRMKLRRDLELTLDYTVGASTDTTVHDLRATRQAVAGVRATPRRNLTLTATTNTYQSGRGLFLTSARSRASSLDLRWRVVPGLDLSATVNQAGALPRNDPRSRTQLYSLTWTPDRTFQLWTTYSRSNQTRRDASSNSLLTGRDVLTARLLANLARTWNVSAGYNVADRGRSDQSRQIDAAVTKRFGR